MSNWRICFLAISEYFCGQYGLKTALEIRSDLRFEISDLIYLLIHVHITYMFWTPFEALLVASEATTASKQPQR